MLLLLVPLVYESNLLQAAEVASNGRAYSRSADVDKRVSVRKWRGSLEVLD